MTNVTSVGPSPKASPPSSGAEAAGMLKAGPMPQINLPGWEETKNTE